MIPTRFVKTMGFLTDHSDYSKPRAFPPASPAGCGGEAVLVSGIDI